VVDLRERLRAVWRELNGVGPRTHAQLEFLKNWLLIMHGWPCFLNHALDGTLPIRCLGTYSWNWVSVCFVTLSSRFCLRSHTLSITTGCWQIHNTIVGFVTNVTCMMSRTKPSLRNVLSEKEIRRKTCWFYWWELHIHTGNTGAFYFNDIGAEDVKLFLLKQTQKSFLFLSETMDIFGQQSNRLAEGLYPL